MKVGSGPIRFRRAKTVRNFAAAASCALLTFALIAAQHGSPTACSTETTGPEPTLRTSAEDERSPAGIRWAVRAGPAGALAPPTGLPTGRCRTVRCSGSWRMATPRPWVSLLSTWRAIAGAGVVAVCGGRVQAEVEHAGGDDLADSADEMAVEGEFPTGEDPFEAIGGGVEIVEQGGDARPVDVLAHSAASRVSATGFSASWRRASRRRVRVVSAVVRAASSRSQRAMRASTLATMRCCSVRGGRPTMIG